MRGDFFEPEAPSRQLSPYEALGCAVIKQAVHDALEYKRNGTRFAGNYAAETFIMSKTLEEFLLLFQLNLSADYIRKLYLKASRSQSQKRGQEYREVEEGVLSESLSSL